MSETKDEKQLQIEPGDLLAYNAGELSPEKRALVEADPGLVEEARALAALEDTFSRAARRIDCPSVEDLLLYEVGLHPEALQRQIASHVEACGACRTELAELEAAGRETDSTGAAPPQPSLWDRIRERVARVIPAVPAPLPDRPVVPVRGSGSRRARYVAEPFAITIVLDPDDQDRWALLGQIERLDDAPLLLSEEARALLTGAGDRTAAVDALGLFTLVDLDSGAYDLVLDLDAQSVTTISLTL